MTKKRLFLLTFLLTTAGWSAVFYSHRIGPIPQLQTIGPQVYLASQLKPDDMRSLKRQDIRKVVDLRPDGEAADQPSSSQMEAASKTWGLSFFYVPVPHETIPDEAVDALGIALSGNSQRTVIYCRSGRRAVRTFALAEASRADGPGEKEILGMVKTAGFSASDLQEKIAARIFRRAPANQEKKP